MNQSVNQSMTVAHHQLSINNFLSNKLVI